MDFLGIEIVDGAKTNISVESAIKACQEGRRIKFKPIDKGYFIDIIAREVTPSTIFMRGYEIDDMGTIFVHNLSGIAPGAVEWEKVSLRHFKRKTLKEKK